MRIFFQDVSYRQMVWLVLGACLILGAMPPAHANNYVVQSVKTEASSTDATSARAEALEKAEQLAFPLLLQQLSLDPTRYANLSPDRISTMITGYDVLSEEVTPTSYAATLNISFDPAQVRAMANGSFAAPAMGSAVPTAAAPTGNDAYRPPAYPPNSRNRYEAMQNRLGGTPYTPTAATPNLPSIANTAPDLTHGGVLSEQPPLLIIPVLYRGENIVLWGEGNLWKNAWSHLSDRIAGTNLVIPLGDLTDMSTLDAAALARMDKGAILGVAQRYSTSAVALAEATITPASGDVMQLNIRIRPVGNSPVAEQGFSLVSPSGEEALLLQGAEKSIARLMGGTTTAASPSYATPSSAMGDVITPALNPVPESAAPPGFYPPLQQTHIKLVAPIAKLADWVSIRKKLQSLSQVHHMNVVAITPNQADVVVQVDGTLDGFLRDARSSGLILTRFEGYWIIQRAV